MRKKCLTDSSGRLYSAGSAAAVAVVSMLLAGSADAFVIDTGNSDLAVRWDNTVRYNLGMRVRDCDNDLCGPGASAAFTHQSDGKFGDAGDVVTNRLDLLTELDVMYKDAFGFRVSAAGWYDHAYENGEAEGNAALPGSYPGGKYTGYVKRYNRGPSGEVLDAFLFTKFNVGEVPITVKAGQHNVYWGEALFTLAGGVAHGQGAVDVRKAAATPGSEAKELFRPLNQVSFSAAITDRLAISGQYFLEWEGNRLPDGGTYFGAADFFTLGGGTVVPGFGLPVAGMVKPKDKTGEWGISARWRPEWLDGSLGFYYREYNDKMPQMVMGLGPTGPQIVFDYRTPRQKLYGVSLAKQLGSVSFGTEFTYRKDAAIAAASFANVIGLDDWRPRGDVITGLVNGVAYFGSNPLFDSAVLQTELTYSRLNRITHDPYGLFAGDNCAGKRTDYGCPTRDAWGLAAQFEPKWFQALPGTDISMPIFLGVGLKGNSPIALGEFEGAGNYSIGVKADIESKYELTLKYNGYFARHGDSGTRYNAGSANWDRDWVSITFKTSF